MSDRLTRKEIKRDEVLEGLARVVEFLREHARALGLGLVGVLVAIAGFAAWQSFQAGREARANLRLTAALESMEASEDGLAAARAALEEVAQEHGGTRAGSVAYAYLGRASADAGDLAMAREHWQRFLEAHPDDALAAQVQRNLISLDRAEGNAEALVERLEGMLTAGSGALPTDSVLWELGRTLEGMGQVEGAIDAYTRLTEEHPTSLYTSRARERSETLSAS